MNYTEFVKSDLRKRLLDCPEDLLDLYTLLAFTCGKNTTLKNVHDAWSVWRNNTKPEHASLIPFDELTAEIQALDEKYQVAIIQSSSLVA